MEKIVIIGGGFAGLNLVKRLDPEKYRISLVDRNNFHCFPPLFYQIASSGLVSANICFPFRREIKKMKNVSYHMGHVKMIDIAGKKVTTSYETLEYDRLIIAAGSTNNYFGMENLAEETFGIKTVAEAAHTRDEILDRLERGAICHDQAPSSDFPCGRRRSFGSGNRRRDRGNEKIYSVERISRAKTR